MSANHLSDWLLATLEVMALLFIYGPRSGNYRAFLWRADPAAVAPLSRTDCY
ncbi:MAG: hypothetical protein V3S33_05250 [Gammaproteobacteria bacterium]